jgi:hypothetical protein
MHDDEKRDQHDNAPRSVAERYKAYFAKVPLKDSPDHLMDHSANI